MLIALLEQTGSDVVGVTDLAVMFLVSLTRW